MVRATCYDKNGELLANLYQWDHDVTVVVHGLGERVAANLEFPFAKKNSFEASVVHPTVSGEYFASVAPNEMFVCPDTMFLYVYEKNPLTLEGRTIAEIRIPIIPRQKPENVLYSPPDNINGMVDGLSVNGTTVQLTSNGEPVGDSVDVGA